MRKRLRYHSMIMAQAMLIGMACVAFGQNDSLRPPSSYFLGLYGGFGLGLEIADLTLPGFDPSCGTLRRGDATSWAAGGLFELPLGRTVALQLRPSVTGQSGMLRETLPTDHPVVLDDGSYALAVIDQVLEYKRTMVGLAALARLALPGGLRAQAGPGVRHVIAARQWHKQVMVEPAELLFANNSREFVLDSGSVIANPMLEIGIEAGIAYDLPISATSTLSPEIMASLPLSSQTTDGVWRSFSLRFGAALRFGRGSVQSLPLPPVQLPETTATTVAPMLAASISTFPEVVSVRIEEYDSTEVLPILNQIFFAESSSDLRPEYRRLSMQETETFTNAQLLGSALDVYYHVLNIVGRRLRQSNATLTINGYRNSRESDPSLSMRRAETIRRYLIEVWGIDSRKLKVTGRGLPPDRAREATIEGYQENARVELIPSDPNILAPVFRRHIQRTATPSAITFHMQAVAEAGVAGWQLAVDEDAEGRFRTFDGVGVPPDSIVWNWRSNEGELPRLPMRLGYTFIVADSAGGVFASSPTGIDVAYQSVQEKLLHQERGMTIETFSLLLFKYGSPKISQSDDDLLRAIAAGVQPGAYVRFTGYTDSLGDEGHNRQLATARAQEAAAIFRGLVPADVIISVDENGGEWERFPFTTPEGRSHCRTVVIELRTPKEGDGL